MYYNQKKIIEEFKTFFFAGSDTTTNLFHMAIYYLAKNPEA